MKSMIVTMAFFMTTVLPQTVHAENADINNCVQEIRKNWLSKTSVHYKGYTRVDESPCELIMELDQNGLTVQGLSENTNVTFEFQNRTLGKSRSLQTCRVDQEKIHFAFEERTTGSFEKRDRFQMTLLKRDGNKMSLILNKQENKILRPLQKSSLICHLTKF